jgi:hypothetical protein
MMWTLDDHSHVIRMPKIGFDALGMAYVTGELEPPDKPAVGVSTGNGPDIRAPFRWHHFVGDE